MKRLVLFLSLLLGAMPALAQHGGGDRPTGQPFATRSPVIAQHGIAATSQPLASQVAIGVLQQGGSAVDAAIAANAALGLMEPTGNGLGGDLFAIVWDPATQQLYGVNASGPAPMGMTLADLKARIGDADAFPSFGSLTVSVPGAVDGWRILHERFGRLSFADVLAPAIGYARGGFPVSQVIAQGWQMNAERFARDADAIEELDNFRSTFLVDGAAPVEGQLFRNPDLAATLQTLADDGPRAFYEGRIADAMDRYMRRIGGPLRKTDLAGYEAEWVAPLSTNYRGYDVYELPPNGQGLAALQMLNILEGYDLAAMGHNSADYLHVQAEAKKLAFEDRARYYADPRFYDAPLETLLSKEYAAGRREMIRMDQALRQLLVFDERPLETGDTIYLTVADGDGMIVSLIQSNYMGMGSGLVPDGLGFMLQNRGALFALDPSHPNVYAPGKRPFHTIIPAFVTRDGVPFLSFGVMGGAMQPQGHVQILNNIIDFGMNVQEAGDAARYRHGGSSQPTGEVMTDGGTLYLESGVDPAVIDDLRRRGHAVALPGGLGNFGGYQAILWDAAHGVYHGATEMRKDGMVAGY
ncbi:MAG: gamma-glutamyltransferase [Rhodothermales bacterium]|nr:gamma-glutamyltransferase [Rhodothermales bacterium]